MPGITALTEAVARYYFKLLAIKDEYEVARLYAETDFVKRVAAQFEGDYKLDVPPRAADLQQARPASPACRRRASYGPWMMKAFRRAREDAQVPRHRARHLRQDRRAQDGAALIGEYEALVAEILAQAHAAEPRDGRRARVGSRAHPRLRAREGSAPEDGEDARGGAARGVPRADAGAEAGGGEGGRLAQHDYSRCGVVRARP